MNIDHELYFKISIIQNPSRIPQNTGWCIGIPLLDDYKSATYWVV